MGIATQAAAPEVVTSGAGPGRAARAARVATRWLGVLPFGAYVALGLAVPTIALAIAAFQNSTTGAATISNFDTALHGTYFAGLKGSIELSLFEAIVPGAFGLLLAYAIYTAKRGNVLRQVVITASASSPTSAACRWRSCSSQR